MACGGYGYQNSEDSDAIQRREALVLQHLPQVRAIARRIHDRLPPHISLDDLVAPGIVGLLAAIDNFDPDLNVQLNTYAERRIRGAILDSLREMDWVPRETRKKSRVLERAIHRLKQRFGREPEAEEIATEVGIQIDEYQAWLSELQGIDLEQLEPADSAEPNRALINVISEDESRWPSRIVERAELERILAQAIERMPKVERTVLSLYYYEEMNLREIAEIMGLHLSRIGQLRVQAILRLRSHLERVWMRSPKRG